MRIPTIACPLPDLTHLSSEAIPRTSLHLPIDSLHTAVDHFAKPTVGAHSERAGSRGSAQNALARSWHDINVARFRHSCICAWVKEAMGV